MVLSESAFEKNCQRQLFSRDEVHGDADEADLARMGYKQELKRDLSMIQNFGMSFSIISVITVCPRSDRDILRWQPQTNVLQGTSSLFLYGLVTDLLSWVDLFQVLIFYRILAVQQ
ncbi:hypothetical protein K439DRAFT_1633455 [Ramaria rubella]|nr:hypothetical protein K439DRAFT_1633455 [Ramaria rubella]